jgi:hypothetical protein
LFTAEARRMQRESFAAKNAKGENVIWGEVGVSDLSRLGWLVSKWKVLI